MKRCSVWLSVLVVIIALTSTSAAAVPRLINYQGALSDSRGVAVEGAHTLTFSFYSSTDAGAPALWREVHRNIDVTDGLFHVVLGSVNPIPDRTFASGQLWIGISVDNDPEIEPRMQMTAVPWAIRAAVADAVVGGSGGEPAQMVRPSKPARASRELMSAQESEMLRTDFLSICDLYYDLGSLMGNENLQVISIEARGEFENLSWEELSIFGESREPVEHLRSALNDFYGLLLSETARGGDESGSPLTPGFPDAEYSLYGSERNNSIAMFAARLVLKLAQGVWSGASRACEEDIAGFNLSLACIPVDIVLFAAEETYDQFGERDNDIDSAEIEGSYERAAHIHGDIELVQTTSDSIAGMVFVVDEKVDILGAKVDTLTDKVDALFELIEGLRETNCDIIRLLNTPSGQRSSDALPCADQPGYPYEWAE